MERIIRHSDHHSTSITNNQMENTVTITKEKLNKFVVCGKHYVTANMANKSLLWIHVDTLLETAIKKLKKIEREKDYVRMKYCKKTATKHIDLSKFDKYQFTEEDNTTVLKEFDRIDAEEIDFPCMIVPKGQYPEKGLTYDIRDSFKGIVIAENEYVIDETLEKRLKEENDRIQMEQIESQEEDN